MRRILGNYHDDILRSLLNQAPPRKIHNLLFFLPPGCMSVGLSLGKPENRFPCKIEGLAISSNLKVWG